VAFAGYEDGAGGHSYTGWQSEQGIVEFDRTPFLTDRPTYQLLRTPDRVDGRSVIFNRDTALKAQYYRDNKGMAGLDDWMKDFYARHPKVLELDRLRNEKIEPQRAENQKKYGQRYIMSQIWSSAWGAVRPPRPEEPEKSDWADVRKPAYKVNDPVAMSKLIKKVTLTFGATNVGIARLNPAWVYSVAGSDGRGYKRGQEIEIPEWWQTAIVFGVPHEWDVVKSNPTYGTSSDAYARASIASARLSAFIKGLGYPARDQSPNAGYEVMVPPIMVDAGLGEQGRFGFAMTPEVGGNFRPAAVLTNLPLEPDKPINFGLKDYCMHCKICAEQCPSKSIPFDDPKETRGLVKWTVDHETCFNFWRSVVGSGSCRICLAVCPWSRKNAWLHNASRHILARDPSRLSSPLLTEAQKLMYEMPDVDSYNPPTSASYRPPEWWLQNEPFIDVSAPAASGSRWDALGDDFLAEALEI
jgi:epoxyqueuosine reductase